MRFTAELERTQSSVGSWWVIYLSFNVREAFGSAGIVRVRGKVNEFAFQSSIFPNKRRGHFLVINEKMRKAVGVKEPGTLLDVELELDGPARMPAMPAEFASAL